MKCQKCGNDNSANAKFCLKCGESLASAGDSAPNVNTEAKSDPLSMAAIITGPAGIVGAGLIILGWLMPWFGFGDLISQLGSLGGSSLPVPSVGTGAQLSLFTFIIGLVLIVIGVGGTAGGLVGITQLAGASIPPGIATGMAGLGIFAAIIGLLIIAVGGLLVAIPVLAIASARSGGLAFGERSLETTEKPEERYNVIVAVMNKIHGRAKFTLIVMLVMMSPVIVLGGINMLGSGFFISILGTAICMLIPVFVKPLLLKHQKSIQP